MTEIPSRFALLKHPAPNHRKMNFGPIYKYYAYTQMAVRRQRTTNVMNTCIVGCHGRIYRFVYDDESL